VANLKTAEKASLLTNGASGVPRINWPAYNWWSESLHGVARNGVATSFPQICGVASSYNKTLFHAIGDVTGTEGRGINNNVQGGMYHGLTFWAPNVNIFRDPRWGRGEETPGEDPTLNGEYAINFVQGMQTDQSTGFIKASACLKHYAAYSEESGRNGFAAMVTSQDMTDTYLPAFEAGVETGKASGIMCSYNAESYGEGIYGSGTQGGAIPSCANKGILNDLARDKWGFDGYITSDCGAVGNVQNQHHYTKTPLETVTAVLSAGMDTDCGGFMDTKQMSSLLGNSSVEALVDTALENLFAVQFRLGFGDADKTVPWASYNRSVVNTPAHQALAKEAADQSLVLLKNDAKALPWKAKPGMSVAVIGRNANATTNMQGNYFGQAPFLISPAEGISKYASTTVSNGKDVLAAMALVAKADAVVLVVGLTSEGQEPADEAEGHDRTSLLLPDNQDALIAAVTAEAAKHNKPVIVVTMGGGPVDISAVKANADIGAIIWCGYPGQSGGTAIADAIFGTTNAFGKLSMTWYPESFAKQVSIFDMGMRPNATSGNPGRTYRFYTGTPVFKFGTGLSYTSFGTSVTATPTIDVAAVEKELDLTQGKTSVVANVVANVKNMGDRSGDEVVMIFAAPPNAGKDGAPLRALVAFERVTLAAGQATTLSFAIKSHHFTYGASKDGRRTVPAGTWKVWAGADNEAEAVEVTIA